MRLPNIGGSTQALDRLLSWLGLRPRTARDEYHADRFLVVFSSGSAAVDLWAFGEDDLADRMLAFEDDQMLALWRTAATFFDENYPLPVTGRKVSLGIVIAFACMHHLEGQLRPLARQRRRAASAVPSHLVEAKAAKNAEVSELLDRLTRGK